jgi:AraC-like DNA-binding protein
MTGAVFYNVTARAPWVAEQLSSEAILPLILPGADHVIAYHIITEGRCFVNIIGKHEPVELRAGQVIVFNQADKHTMSSSPGMRGEPVPVDALAGASTAQMPFTVTKGGTGPITRVICGFLACNARPFNPLLDSLPAVLIADSARDGNMPRLGELIRLAVEEASSRRTASESVLGRLTELMFVEVVRQYLDCLPLGQDGWLAGLKDPCIGRALSLMHANPANDWRLDELAREAGSSRSEFAQRFAGMVGVPPMVYLARWRMQVASGLLRDNVNIASVAAEVGYGSEASFSRAFKKIVGAPPSRWRNRQQSLAA